MDERCPICGIKVPKSWYVQHMKREHPPLLNLGCGRDIREDAVNVDVVDLPDVTVCDLEQLPWPWPDGRFERVLALSIIEHLRPNLVTIMDEIWRVLRIGGALRVKVPYSGHVGSFNGLHYWQYSLRSFDKFDPDTRDGKVYGYYTARKWKLVEVRLNKPKTSLYVDMAKR